MGDMGFLQSLKNYDKDSLASNQRLTAKLQVRARYSLLPTLLCRAIELVFVFAQTYIKRDDFNAESVSRVSKAATSLCMWVIAMDVYGRVARGIEPKKVRGSRCR